jgi:hypothetical protein
MLLETKTPRSAGPMTGHGEATKRVGEPKTCRVFGVRSAITPPRGRRLHPPARSPVAFRKSFAKAGAPPFVALLVAVDYRRFSNDFIARSSLCNHKSIRVRPCCRNFVRFVRERREGDAMAA